jgi:hypothetical protein
MTDSTTMDAPRVRQSETRVVVEDDASPLVRLIGRTLRDAALCGHVPEVLARTTGVVAVRSHDTPQAATISFREGAIEVESGVLAEPDATVVVDLNARFSAVEGPEGDSGLGANALMALTPPLPHWRAAGQRFWEVTRGIRGIPDVLVVDAHGPDGAERARFGVGESEYLIAGPADLLAGVCSGADDFLASLAAGVQVKGSLSQLSVMTAASWKVRFDV